MPKLEAIIFDVDGTLADTERDIHRVAFNRAFVQAGLDWEWTVERYGELIRVAGGKERILAYLQAEGAGVAATENLSSEELWDWAATLHGAKKHHYQQLLQADVPLRPGVKRLTQAAREAGIRLAIATTSDPDNVLALLETSLAPGSATWFEVIAAGDVVPAKKPAPDIYLYALQKLGLSADSCLAIEDSYQGLQAATAAGLKTVITVNGYTQHENFADAILVLDHLGELDQPCQILAGVAPNAICFDLALAHYLLEHQAIQ